MRGKRLLIVGGASTVANYLGEIGDFDGDVWACNDSILFLAKHKVSCSAGVVSDHRFFRKSATKWQNVAVNELITLTSIQADLIPDQVTDKVTKFQDVGCDFHGIMNHAVSHCCTVAAVAVQVAIIRKYSDIRTVGVLLDPPISYMRIDGSRTMPEFVYDRQIKNFKRLVRMMEELGITFSAFENESTMNYL